jgi:hypothetical protein
MGEGTIQTTQAPPLPGHMVECRDGSATNVRDSGAGEGSAG